MVRSPLSEATTMGRPSNPSMRRLTARVKVDEPKRIPTAAGARGLDLEGDAILCWRREEESDEMQTQLYRNRFIFFKSVAENVFEVECEDQRNPHRHHPKKKR
jgi:hypothetical protein